MTGPYVVPMINNRRGYHELHEISLNCGPCYDTTLPCTLVQIDFKVALVLISEVFYTAIGILFGYFKCWFFLCYAWVVACALNSARIPISCGNLRGCIFCVSYDVVALESTLIKQL